MLILGSVMAVMGFALLWFSPFSGILIMVIGLGIVWSYEDQKARTKNEQKRYEEEKELEFNRIKYSDPVSASVFELSTLLYGSIKPHETWLLENLNDFEEFYSNDPGAAIAETQTVATGKFRNLFESATKYSEICDFLNRDYSREIFEDIQKLEQDQQGLNSDNADGSETVPTLSEVLEEYDLEEWAKSFITDQVQSNNDRNVIIKNAILEAKKELDKEISVSCLRNEWIINGKIRFKI